MKWSELPSLIDPIAFSIGNFSIYWYSLSYLLAFFIVYFLLCQKIKSKKKTLFSKFEKPKTELFDFLMFCFLGVIVGGRLGYVIFYNLKGFITDPLSFLLPFQDGSFVGYYGMSFHGGLIGVILATLWYAKKNKLNFFNLANFIVPAIPLGYFFGRIGNFLNGELFGRPTESFVGMKFPKDELGLLRHPSQLYEAFGEGILLFLIIFFLQKKTAFKAHALALFLFFYGIVRFVIEFFREPDPHLGTIFLNLTTGQILCIGMTVSGIFIFYYTSKPKKMLTEIEINHLFVFFSYLVSIAFYAYLVVAIIFLILDNRQNTSTFAWIFIFILLPVVGLVFYIFFGKNHRIVGKHRKKIHQMIGSCFPENTKRFFRKHQMIIAELTKDKSCPLEKKLALLLEKNSYSLLTDNNQVEILQNGKEKFPTLIRDIKNAKKTIHLTYFIWRKDNLTKQIRDILIEKSKNGIKVRILIDAWGGIFLSQKYKMEMRKAGIKILRYFDFRFPFTTHTVNYRNHRKIAVIDGKIGYTGGINMGEEYLNGDRRFNFWRDTHLRIKGDAVIILQSIFALEWENTTKEKLLDKKYFPEIKKHKDSDQKTRIQITTSGPDSSWESVRQMFFVMINNANKKIEIQSPYFVPDESLVTALKTAALSGVDIKVMITGLPDKKLPYWAAFTYFEELLRAGVKIFHYQKGFLHSKTISVDSKICSIGTANFDIRSCLINYELMALFYDENLTRKLEKDFEKDLKECTQMTKERYQKINPLAKFRNSVARLFSSIL